MLIQLTILLLSIVALYWGAEFTLEAGEEVGNYFGLSPLVIGLLLIGFGTSLPEFFVSQLACLRGEDEIALGNIIGSNITNLFLILGVSGFMAPLTMISHDIKRQVVIHLILTLILGLIIFWVGINPISTALLVIFFICYMWATLSNMKTKTDDGEVIKKDTDRLHFLMVVRLLFGFALLYMGGEFLVKSGTQLGHLTGTSPFVISAILVAFGTSFPELVTAILACVKKKDTNLITGNIIGSNIFNVAFVMGSIGFYDVKIEKDFTVEIAALLFAACFLLLLVFLKKNFQKISAFIYLTGYVLMVSFWLGYRFI
jgi:cation:H+ antiporter